MTRTIPKLASQKDHLAREIRDFSSARAGFEAILRSLHLGEAAVLLPAYIGWSAREGSGVFDPIQKLNLRHKFYALDENLRIDLNSIKECLSAGKVGAMLIIHYFGYVDPGYREAVQMAREANVFVIEDAAHALLSDLIGGSCGRLGDACIYSFHKLLPLSQGGGAIHASLPEVSNDGQANTGRSRWQNFDLYTIASRRIALAKHLDGRIAGLMPFVQPLWGLPGPGEIVQTYPVLIRGFDRDQLYTDMNESGFGVVSLYHTMISAIATDLFPKSHKIAKSILNLPVHQDTSTEAIDAMVDRLQALVTPK